MGRSGRTRAAGGQRGGGALAARPGTAIAGLAALVALAALLLAGGPLAPAALADGEIAVSIADVDDSRFPQVTAVITADRDGRPLTELRPDEIRATEGGAPASVTSVTRGTDGGIPLALVLTIDTSGSMQGQSMEQARAAASGLAQRLGNDDAAAVIAFSDEARVVQPLSRDRGAVQAAIGALQPLGNTALYDAVAESARVASESGYVRRAVVLLSDGRDFGARSQITLEQSLDRAAQGGAIFYVVGVGPDIDRAYLEEVARRSGGRFFAAAGATEVPAIYAALEELLRAQFVVTLDSTAPATGVTRDLTLEIRQAAGQGLAQRSYTSRRPEAAATPVAPVATAAPAPTVAPAAPVEESGGPPLAAIGGGVALLLVAGVALIVVRRRRAPDLPPVEIHLRPRHGAERPPAAGVLRVVAGPAAVAEFELAEAPAMIGSGPDCQVRLTGEGIAPEHARIWWRDGKPMLHHIAEGYETRVNGRTVDWASLDAGYEIEVGPLTLRFEPALPDLDATAGAGEALRPGA